MLLGKDRGTLYDLFDLNMLNPPITPDPQFGWAGVLLRNAAAIDGRDIFLLVNGELIRLRYDPDSETLSLYERSRIPGFSSSTPTLDVSGKRMFLVTFDPEHPEEPPMLRCFNYENRPIEERWSIETNIDFLESEDQLTVTYLPEQGIIVNNSLYGHLSAYIEGSNGQPQQLWSTRDTIGPDVAAYIASATQPDGILYFVENFSKTLYALDAETGSVLWSHEIPSQSIKTPIPHQGKLYVDHNYGLVAFGSN
jgi:hypothetical protein